GSFGEEIPDALFARMAKAGVTYDPTLSVVNVLSLPPAGRLQLLHRSLVQQVGPTSLIEAARSAIESGTGNPKPNIRGLDTGRKNLLRAYRAGVMLVTGSDAGNALVIHGPTVQQELALWVEAGIPAEAALRAATYNAARALRADNRIGAIEP